MNKAGPSGEIIALAQAGVAGRWHWLMRSLLILVVLSWLVTLALAAPNESQAQFNVSPLSNPLESLAQSSKALPFIDAYKASSTGDNGPRTYRKLLLEHTGSPIYDPRNGLTKPRIEVDAAVQQRSSHTIDLLSDANVQIDGASDGDQAGKTVAEAGDVNGDEIDDVIIGAPYADDNDRIDSGSAYVIFGRESTETIDLDDLGEQGFRIDGAASGDKAGASVAAADDVNGDGRPDVIVGAYGTDNNGRDFSGSAYVIYGNGRDSTETIDLSELGEGGFRIDGAASGDYAGRSIAGAGDVNGDDRPDVIVGAPNVGNNDHSYSGSAYVIYGRDSTGTIDLNELGVEDGFRIDGAAASDYAGSSVAGVGDVNGDDRDDVIVGASSADNNGSSSGSAYVIYGTASNATIDLNELGEGGFRIDGAAEGDRAGISVASVSDMNGDGRDDVIIGASFVDSNGTDSGSAYVIYGRESTETIDLNELGEGGFRIDGAASDDRLGSSVASASDMNGDGHDDVIVGAILADNNGRSSSGSAYVIYGRESTGSIDLNELSVEDGFRIDGAAASDYAGSSVAGVGDVNGDDRDDVIVGASSADNNGRTNSGSAYIINRYCLPKVFYDSDSLVATAGEPIEPLRPTITGTDPENVSFTTTPDLPDGLTLDPNTGVISGTPTRSQFETTYTITMTHTFGCEASAEITIEVALGFTYEPGSLVAVKDKAIEPLVPTVSGTDPSDMNLRFEVSPRLPAGLGLDPDNGIISGTPATVRRATTYTVTVTQLSDDQTATTDVTIEVKLQGLVYKRLIAAVAGEEIETLVPDIYGAEVDDVDFTVSPALPAGLGLDPDNGEISGTPTEAQLADTYTVTMSQPSENYTATARVTIRVDLGFTYEPDSLITLRGEPIQPLTPTVVGADPFDDLSFTVTPSLPAGLSLDPISGVISGVPLGVQRKTRHTFTVTSLSGDLTETASVAIQVKILRPNTIDLGIDTDLRIDGAAESDYAGRSVSDAGDVNGDGREDVIVGADGADNNGSRSGSAYVIYGRESTETIDLDELDAEDGFRIDGAASDDYAGYSVSGAGDVNGDGLDDVIVGAPYADNNGTHSGSAYVIYGRDSTETIDLGELDAEDGFRIDGATYSDTAGESVAGAGDVNGDGRDDVIIGADGADNNDRWDSGSAYVIYGRDLTGTIDLDELGEGGFRIDGATHSDHAGRSVSSAGDVNGDGLDDVIVGAPYADNNGIDSGSAYVIYGGDSTDTIYLKWLDAEDGFRIVGVALSDNAGRSVAGAGDVNGDGRDDVIVGADGADNNGSNSGSAYVIYGRESTNTIYLDWLDVFEDGFRIDGVAVENYAGYSVSGAGDVNGDGRDDVIVGAWAADNNRRPRSGSAYVIYGRDSTDTIDLNELGEGGFRIDGAAVENYAGYSVSGAGDVNGDGRPDVIVGAYLADNNGREYSGSAYVVYSPEP